MSKDHCTQGLKIPFISNLKKPACASKRDMLEIATLSSNNETFCFYISQGV